MSDNWKTDREKLYGWLTEAEGEFPIKEIMRDLEYTDIQSLVNDFNSLTHKLKRNGKNFLIRPSECLACGYVVKLNSGKLRIPSKCPNCHEERLDLPMIKIENKI